MYRDASHPSRGRCPSPPPLKLPDEQVWVPPPPVKIDQQAILRCMRGSRAELWGNVGKTDSLKSTSDNHASNVQDSACRKVGNGDIANDTLKSGSCSRDAYYSSVLGSEYPSFSNFLNARTSRGYLGGLGGNNRETKPETRPAWKFDPPTFKFGAEDMEEEEPKPSEVESQASGKKRQIEDDEDEWIQSPFCGDRYRKKDVDLLVAFANKYIKSANEYPAKRQKMEDSEGNAKDEKF